MNYSRYTIASILTVALLVPGLASANEPAKTQANAAAAAADDETEGTEPLDRTGTIGRGEAAEDLPKPQSDNDPTPPAAAPRGPIEGVVRQAGVGGITAYGRAGVLELGGSASFSRASDFTQLTLNPSIGWFFMDNVQASAILGLSHLSAQGVDTTFLSFLLEPSLHIPFSDTVFGFIGAGVGPSWADGPGLGLAFAPRIGMNVAVGRSGILTPSAFLQYSTHEALVTPAGALLAVSMSYGAGIGYTVMW